ncbi:TetR/AcrR family transcriptional regulator [Marinitenerispora sediminis]|uniref:TetR family transcriptional regulator n=1 Tax=Marinitenerispora sediminis TaxID=1931232 RepID=A0A368SYT6_9ACTN|nr:TetR family transcriptional regulator [Marinitenerispora sediminis]RCV47581.1 TetR family transcriptional regulator [Marinitenerispora sediminis]RCV48714.1 TetR family transcriptional regulator [Marinitenerispora sediminis]RCV49866.1 TetR family transcriptional regulator [Marinitenerispora sediminis]
MSGRGVRAGRSEETRELILAAAERLFAENGVATVSNRQVSEAAGQGNNFAVGYHFGTKTELVRAIVRKHADHTERLRLRMLAESGDIDDLRGWVACLVRPPIEHLAALGSPTWYARFGAQIMTDPALRSIMVDEALTSAAMQRIVVGINRCRPALPDEVRLERSEMARHLIVHTCAERERSLAEGAPTPRSSWDDTATGLIDAIVGLWLAPVTSVG